MTVHWPWSDQLDRIEALLIDIRLRLTRLELLFAGIPRLTALLHAHTETLRTAEEAQPHDPR